MESYSALAEVYDRFMYDVDYQTWVEYLHEFLQEYHVKRVIETACGTGNITVRLAEQGYEVIASDCSEQMLRIAQQKVREKGLDVMLIQQAMQELEMPKRDALLCVCDGVNYLNPKGIKDFFVASAKCIKPGGILLFDVSSPYKLQYTLGDHSFFDDQGDCVVLWENCYHDAQVEMNVTVFSEQGDLYARSDETQVQYAHQGERIVNLLKLAGFEQVCEYGFLTRKPPKVEEQRIQYVAIRSE